MSGFAEKNISARFLQNSDCGKKHVFFLPQFCGKKRKFMFSAAAEKNITLKGIIFPRNRVVTGVGMDGLKAQPARSLPLPR